MIMLTDNAASKVNELITAEGEDGLALRVGEHDHGGSSCGEERTAERADALRSGTTGVYPYLFHRRKRDDLKLTAS
ncbi:MAG: hypothetical protein AAGE98_09040, partial [Actinomycetota bacterium]